MNSNLHESKTIPSTDSTVGLLLSGGLDSAILLNVLIQSGDRVQPFYICSGLSWERDELRAVDSLIEAFHPSLVEPLVTLDLPLEDLYGDHWSTTGQDVPDAQTPDEAVFLPGRNALLLLKPGLWCLMHGIDRLALGLIGSNPFDDATSDFFDHFESALNGCLNGRLKIIRPFDRMSKLEVMRQGRDLPLERTFSCIAPNDGNHCGRCNKCAERQAAFRLIDRKDPTTYKPASLSEKGDRLQARLRETHQ